MKIVINTSNIKQSGALQVTLSFLEELKRLDNHQYIIILSDYVKAQLNIALYPDNFLFEEVKFFPPFSKGHKMYRRSADEVVSKYSPDCIFSVFGPTYWKPKIFHVCGFAYPWAVNQDSKYIRKLPLKAWLKQKAEVIFKSYHVKREAEEYVVETDDVKRRLVHYLGISEKKIHVVNNTFNHHFNSPDFGNNILGARRSNEFRLVTISSNFPHKNLAIIKEVSANLKTLGYDNIHFYLTISTADGLALFGRDSNIHCLGVIKASECPQLYSECDVMLLPTHLECFTATYPEAMKMKKPIITSDLDFARTICGKAALYFNPFSADDIIRVILLLMSNKAIYEDLIEEGNKILNKLPSASDRALSYLGICENIKQTL